MEQGTQKAFPGHHSSMGSIGSQNRKALLHMLSVMESAGLGWDGVCYLYWRRVSTDKPSKKCLGLLTLFSLSCLFGYRYISEETAVTSSCAGLLQAWESVPMVVPAAALESVYSAWVRVWCLAEISAWTMCLSTVTDEAAGEGWGEDEDGSRTSYLPSPDIRWRLSVRLEIFSLIISDSCLSEKVQTPAVQMFFREM